MRCRCGASVQPAGEAAAKVEDSDAAAPTEESCCSYSRSDHQPQVEAQEKPRRKRSSEQKHSPPETEMPSAPPESDAAAPAEQAQPQCYDASRTPSMYSQRRCTVLETSLRALSLQQLGDALEFSAKELAELDFTDDNAYSKTHGQQVTRETMNMYHFCGFFLKRLTFAFQCSFMELVADAAQPPVWFVSHFWGNVLQDTVQSLRFHAESRALPYATAFYWICTFANNQWDLGELGGKLQDTPFHIAIMSIGCEGVVMVLDSACTPFTRSWCGLELHTAVGARSVGKRLDMVAQITEGSQSYFHGSDEIFVPVEPGIALRMDTGGGVYQDVVQSEMGRFPPEVLLNGSTMAVQKMSASVEGDRINILRLQAGMPEGSTEQPPEQCDGYDRINGELRAIFYPPLCWHHARKGEEAEVQQLLAIAGQACLSYVDANNQSVLWTAAA